MGWWVGDECGNNYCLSNVHSNNYNLSFFSKSSKFLRPSSLLRSPESLKLSEFFKLSEFSGSSLTSGSSSGEPLFFQAYHVVL